MEHFSSPYANELAVAIAAAKEAAIVVRDLYERSAAESYVKGDGLLPSPMPILPPIALSGNDSRAHFQMTRS